MSATRDQSVVVAAERLEGFLARFAARHGEVSWNADPSTVTVRAADGAIAVLTVPFPPLPVSPTEAYGGLVTHAMSERRVGVLLARRGGYAAGVFDGPRLVASKVGSRHVQGRSAAGGWSQQRFARRRVGQTRVAQQAATDALVATVLPVAGTLTAMVAGGDRRVCDQVLSDPRVERLRGLLVEPRLDVPDPRRRVLEGSARMFRALRVHVREPEIAGGLDVPEER